MVAHTPLTLEPARIAELHSVLMDRVDPSGTHEQRSDAMRKELRRVLAQRDEPWSEALAQAVLDEALALGPLTPLLRDPKVNEVMVVAPDRVYVEEAGRIRAVATCFSSEEAVRRVAQRMVDPLGRSLDESSPIVDGRLPDGSRIHAVVPPIALKGTCITIRRFPEKALSAQDLVSLGTLNEEALDLLRRAVEGRLNLLVSGGTGSGKTTLLNVLSGFIPEEERIVTIEDAAELRLHQTHVVSLESRPANGEGRGSVTIRDLVRASLRMRPDRIVVGECRGGEALDMLQAMNTGHEGSMTTVHANSPQEALGRIEVLALMAGMELPLAALRQQIGGALDLVVQTERCRDGSKRVSAIAELNSGVDGNVLDPIYIHDGKELRPTGLAPRALSARGGRRC